MNDAYLPDFIDDPSTILTSFQSIRERTLDTLYASGVDKSPKGSVDAPIRDLVDLINKHPSFATLSSCSGRIAVFDPVRAEANIADVEATEQQHDDDVQIISRSSDRMESGKGSGGWLFVSHDLVDVDDMESVFQSDETNHREGKPCTFRLEPMLLHVAAANLERGRQLMKIVLALGFRESGMIVTPSRVTVAVRSYSLALNVPMGSGPFLLPETYWRSLVQEANCRLEENLSRKQGLYDEIETTLFQPRQPIYVQPLPDLNLWGHAAVAVIGENKGKEITDVIVIGGYGCGPAIMSDKKESAPSRSDKIYRLRRNGLHWQKHWEILHSMNDTDILDDAETNSLGIASRQTPWTAREFAAACILPVEPTVLCVFGGRASPTRPLDDFLLCEYTYSSYAIAQCPADVRGESPIARWGHTLSALGGDSDKLAVLVGGRNETAALHSVHVLSIVQHEVSEKSYLLWETILLTAFMVPRFHHAAVSFDDQVLIFGGLSDVNSLLESFSASESSPIESFLFNALDTRATASVPMVKGISSESFGLAAVLLDIEADQQGLILVGGLSVHSQGQHHPIQLFELEMTANVAVEAYSRSIKLLSENCADFGAAVHHQCLSISATSPVLEIVSIGGGVQGFGFQQTYAKSHMMTVDLSKDIIEADQLTPMILKKRLVSKAAALHSVSPSRSIGSEESEPGLSDVLLVKKKDAKVLKTLLEASSFLDLTYRMSSIVDSDFIAVPVTRECLALLDSDQQLEWRALVQGRDKQVLPYRSAAFATRRR